MRMPDDVPLRAWREAMHDGVWDALRPECPVTHILDIGACVGYFSIWARMRWPTAKVLAVEPDGENYECLSDNLKGLDASVVRAGLGDGAPLALASKGWCCSTRLYRTVHGGEGIPSFGLNNLASVLLDGANDPLLLIKIDCEGGEQTLMDYPREHLDALRSCAALAIEFHHGSVKTVGPWLLEALRPTHSVRSPRSKCQIWVRNDLCANDPRFKRIS